MATAGSSKSVPLATDPAVCATPEVESAQASRGGREGGIVVVGGYGAVGRTVCAVLAARFPRRVFADGRNLRKAQAFSREIGGRALPLKLDLVVCLSFG